MRRLILLAGVLVLLSVTVLVLVDPVFWDRYLRAYRFETFVNHPFPTVDRLYPQEPVAGVAQPRSFPVSDAADRTISAQALEAAAEFAEKTDSTSLIVCRHGRIQLERYWHGADAQTPVYSFSMHKSVVALLVGIAISEGHIKSVDDDVGEYLAAWRGDPRGRIPLRDLLQMNSGLEPMAFPNNPFSKHVRRQIGTDLAAAALSYRLVDPPGTVFRYNGVNPTLLVMVLQQATGMRYAQYLSSRLWRPLGNHDAAVWLDKKGGLARGATSLFAVPRDWLRIGEMILHHGRVGDRQVVPETWLREMITPSSTNPLYGYLTWIGSRYAEQRTLQAFKGFAAMEQEPFSAQDIIYFDGLGGQRVYVIPSQDLVIVRTGVLARKWEDTELPNLLVAGIKQ